MMQDLIDELSRPDAYPHPVGDVEVCQTHISVVFLAGDYAYKLKKPLDLGFVDYSTLARRRHFCEREVTLNERLAPDVYLDVVAICGNGRRRVELHGDADDVVEWAVRMRRLDDSHTLLRRLEEGRVDDGIFEQVGRRLARFHEDARGGDDIDEAITFDRVRQNALDNFEQSRHHVGEVVDEAVFERVERLTRRRLTEQAPLICRRARNGVARDTHGDLRLEHVYLDDDGELFVVDCIEFNDGFRFADPVCDISFLAMDLGIRGYDEGARRLLDAYFDARDDREGRDLVDFYVAYRSCVRAKVHGFKAGEEEVPADQRRRAQRKGRAHWLYALSRLEPAGKGPALLMLAGLPAAGKSTLGRRLVEKGGADLLIESDVVRKELAGLNPGDDADAEVGRGIYTPEFTQRTYAEVARRVEAEICRGRRVAVAATFVRDEHRKMMVGVAGKLGVPVHFLECRIDDDEAHRRLQARVDDVSDAGVEVYEALKERWESPSPEVARVHQVVDTTSSKTPDHGDEDHGHHQKE